ncbi:transcription antitermination factor NusB [Mediterraneibacter catenae]|uniref:Transcription antitermination protein NusB n=1 Tax=Mediterraneibacter catenae TaxID=2594882 RepID=A0A5M9I0Y5_9FIRM|nr:transcription antitermination factor NusB [Mediterraneibacter catenae]KAA8502563.1 transcription antitermination factor NusB [Mediterraneibacter catenae]
MTRSELREHVFKMLFQIEFNEAADMPEHLQYYFETIDNVKEKDREYIQKKYQAVSSHVEEIDKLLNEAAKGWRTSRMNKVDLTILRLAVYEMKWDEDVPEGVAINEAVELAKRFGGDGSSSFVNGVLGRLAKQES